MISKFKWIVLPCAAALFAAAMAPWTFSGTAMRNEVARQLRRTTGLIAETDGRAVFALLPRPRIKIENIRIHDPSGSLQIDADFLRGNLRILPMFAGRLEITSAALVAPRMRIDVDFDRASANGAISRAARLMNSGRPANNESQTERLGILSIVDGSATLTIVRV
jgi:AsmA protein